MFRSLFDRLRRRAMPRQVRLRPSFHPALEGLERRDAPAVLTVNSTADSTSTGNNVLTLREAVGLVNGALSLTAGEKSQVSGTLGSNDTIQFNLPSTPQTITLTGGSLTLSRLVTINGPGASNLTINANQQGRVFVVNQISTQNLGLTTTINGLDIAGGSALYGGALLNSGSLTVTNCIFAGNTAGNSGGGGVYNAGTLSVSNTTFTNNTVTSGGSGGGIQNASSSTLTVTNCVFTNNTGTGSGNSASQGAAIANSGQATVSASTFTGNTVTSDGGAIYQSSSGTMTISSSSFVNSSAGSDGGAIRNGGALTLNYCLFTGNTSASEGGAIDTSNSMTATGCTFDGNTAVSQGGAIEEESGGSAAFYNTTITANRVTTGDNGLYGGGLFNNSPVKLFNTIVAGNLQGQSLGTTANDIYGSVDASSAYNLIGTGGSGGLVNGVNGNQVGVSNPGLDILANNGGTTLTVALLPGSPAIDAGSNAYVTAGETDQRGLARIGNGTVDVGAVEAQAPAAPTATSFRITGFPSWVIPGAATTFTVTARDAYGNLVTGYTGTVHFTSSDSQAALPADYTFGSGDNGAHTFTVTLNTAGVQSLTITDAKTHITGSQSGVAVSVIPPNTTVLTVNSTADSTSTGSNILTLREAIGLVDGTLQLTAAEQSQVSGPLGSNSDIIQFNLPSGPQTITLTGGALSITNAVTINGPGASSLTINGNNADRVFVVGTIYTQNLSLTASISGVTISGGNAVYGGGLLNFGALTLNNCIFTGNTAGNSGGGGVYNDGALMVSNTTFTNNTVNSGGAGGGILNASSSILSVANCVFTGNIGAGSGSSASEGAALANSGQATVSNSTFNGNNATSNGGAIFNSSAGTMTASSSSFTNNTSGAAGGAVHNDGTLTMTASTLVGNAAAAAGGGIDNQGTLAGLINCTLYGNTSVSDGGGLATSGAAKVVNCTITANSATTGNGGVFGGGVSDEGVAATVFNTIVAGNFQGPSPSTTASDIAGSVDASSAYNLIGTGGSGGLVNSVNGNQVGASNPGLGALANNGGPTLTVALLPGSPAIDHGSNAYVAPGETDQRGLARIGNGTVDVGAVESQVNTATTVAPSLSTPVYGQTLTFTAAVTSPGGLAGTPTGSVQFYLDGNPFGTPVSLGAAGQATSGGISTLAATGHTVSASYSPTGVYASSASGNVSFSIGKAAPTLNINPSSMGGTVIVGTGAKLTASAALLGGPGETGSISFTLYGPSGSYMETETASVTGNGVYTTPGGYLPSVAGTYQWVVSYGGDSNDTGASTTRTPEIAMGSGVTVVGNALYIVGGNTDDQVKIQHVGSSNTGSTGVQIQGRLNGANLNNLTFSQPPAIIYIVAFNGNDSINMENNLAISAVVSLGNGNDNIQLGQGNNSVTVGGGNDQIQAGNGNNVVVANTGAGQAHVNLGNGNNTVTVTDSGAGQANVHLGNGSNKVTVGNGAKDQVNAGDGNNIVTVGNGDKDQIQLGKGNNTVAAGNGNDQVQAGDGNNIVTIGNGNDNVHVGNGSNVVVEGNGNDQIQAGNGNNLIVGGLGKHTIQAGNGSNILIDGSVQLTQSGDSLAQVLSDWTHYGSTAAANIRARLIVTFNTSNANTLHAGNGVDWFWATSTQDHSNRKPTDLSN